MRRSHRGCRPWWRASAQSVRAEAMPPRVARAAAMGTAVVPRVARPAAAAACVAVTLMVVAPMAIASAEPAALAAVATKPDTAGTSGLLARVGDHRIRNEA